MKDKGVAKNFFAVGGELIDERADRIHRDSLGQSVRRLFAAEAFEVGHLVGHFLAGSVGCGTNTLNAKAEFVRVGGAEQCFLKRDELLGVQIEDGLIESLHAVLRSAGRDGVVDEARFVGVDDAIANVGGGDHDFASGDAAFVVGAAYEALRDDGF